MIPLSRRNLAVIIFTLLLIGFVNIAWWIFYGRTERNYEAQLSRRLTSLAQLGADQFSGSLVQGLVCGDLRAYERTLDLIDHIRDADSLSEVFVIDLKGRYLATTLPNSDSVYYLGSLNRIYIDSAFLEISGRPVVTASYRAGDIFLKSAFVPLPDTAGTNAALLGLEADIDYTDELHQLKRNLYISSALSAGGGLLFGLFFFFVQRRINASEKALFLSQAQANLGRMVAVVSHEIKNPLMIIRASAERLKKGNGAPEAAFILEETDRLNNILTGYLDFASGKKNIRIEKIAMSALLSKIVEQFGHRLKSQGVNLLMGDTKEDIFVMADAVALRQVIINLVLNGAEAVKNKENGLIHIESSAREKRGIVEVTDNGSGIDPGTMKDIFEPFFTTRTSGSGLGLYLSKQLITAMRGEISVRSKSGGPTVFMIALPLADENSKREQ
ncbi:putative Histidine kinase [Candidatus Zixiibacteriota bacterium]|nr:putative Histidine kinase [candidate division Zixibacteria bacterium]